MAKKHKAGPGPCVHCLAHVAERTWDHLFARSWYPDTTPENLELWKFPACQPCNRAYGELEQDLLLRVGLCLDPTTVAASGIPADVLRGMDPAAAHNEQDRRAREARRQKILNETFVVGPEHTHAIIPGFGARPNTPPIGIGIPAQSLERLVEKFARGLTYLRTGLLITPAYAIEVFVDPQQGALVDTLLTRFGKREERGPGVTVAHAFAKDDDATSIFAVVLWGVFHLWGVVRRVNSTNEDAADHPRELTPASEPADAPV